jgi:UTP--glucose-1-phosphate uridylyltransferase
VEIQQLVEKPKPGTAPSNLAVFGRYVLPPEVFDLLEKTQPGAGGEIQLTDALDALARQGRLVGHIVQGVRYDAGDRLGYLKANVAYALKRPELREGLLAFLREVVEGR